MSFEPDDFTEAAAANADPANWEWHGGNVGWELAMEHWQKFNEQWYGAATLHDPASPFLSLGPLVSCFDKFPPKFLVRECYLAIFKRVWTLALATEGEKGAIIRGQPGTGKTALQLYILVQLLQHRQVVLFSLDGERLYLFYFGKVYTITLQSLAEIQPGLQLPTRTVWSSHVFIWSLFDIADKKGPPMLLVTPPCLPVQMVSPDPIRFQMWDEEFNPLQVGMPLWTRDELAQGLPHQKQYGSLLAALRRCCEGSQDGRDPLECFPGARTLLNELQVGYTPEEALNHLLHSAIDRFGYTACDVFEAIFDYQSTTKRHEEAFDFMITFSDLKDAASALATNRVSPKVSHSILAVSPIYSGPYTYDQWTVNFKSDWVAKSVMKKLQGMADQTVIRHQINVLRLMPGASGLAGYFLEPLTHRIFSELEGKPWPLFGMTVTSDGTFSTDPNHVPVGIRFPSVQRNIVIFDFSTDLFHVDLENRTYYIPLTPDLPLLDAFTIDIDCSSLSAVLWVILITTSHSHGGDGGGSSVLGYQHIRAIIAKLKEQLGKQQRGKKKRDLGGQTECQGPSVQVRYLLVGPKGGSKNLKWCFPKGWNDENCVRDDHRGDVYCLELPIEVYSVRSSYALIW